MTAVSISGMPSSAAREAARLGGLPGRLRPPSRPQPVVMGVVSAVPLGPARGMAYYWMLVKHVKNEWPATSCECTGLILDTAAGELRLSGERQGKLRSLLELYIHLGSQGGSVPRLELASVIGKLQFCCLAVLAGQAHMRAPMYVARDPYDPSAEASASWLPDVVCQ